jgi:Ion channel
LQEVSQGRIAEGRIATVEQRISADLLDVLNIADQARLEGRTGTANSEAGVEAAVTLIRIAYRFELLARGAHLIEITAWAGVFDLCREFPNFAPAFYHSAVNYTSLGYGDVVMSSSWKLLGPLETADGMLMFGMSTATLFAVIQRLIQTRFRDADG